MSQGGARRPDPGFWSGKRVLLTGHTGFKGSWAALWLHRLGAEVTGLALVPDQTPNLHDLIDVDSLVESHLLDIRDRTAVTKLIAGRPFEIVLHMAAQPIVRASIEDPVGTFATNVMGVAHLLDALRGGQPQAVLVVTSDKVYANEETASAFAEGDPLGGKDPYSASKAAAEIVAASYARSFFAQIGVPVATARAGNVIGGGDFSRDRLICDIVRAARAGTAPVLRHPEATRPWQHVLDCVAGYLVYLETLSGELTTPRSMNFGPAEGAPVTVGELANAALKAFGIDQPWIHVPDPASIEARNLAIDAALARRALGFSSRLDGRQAVAMTMDWYRAQALGEDPRTLCLDQIALYESLP